MLLLWIPHLKPGSRSFNDSRISYYRNKSNFGAVNVVDNWNKCLEYATGEYIICMGDDDKLLPCCLEEYYKLTEKHPGLRVYHGRTEIIDDNSNFKDFTASRPEYESVYSMIWHRRTQERRQFIGDFLFDRKALIAVGGFYKLPMAWGSDDITACIAASYKGIANTQKIVFQYRENTSSITNSGNITAKMEAVKKERQWYHLFLLEEPLEEIDQKFHFLLCSSEQKYYEKKIGTLISWDLKQHWTHIYKWWRNKKKYQISNKVLLYSIYILMKDNMSSL